MFCGTYASCVPYAVPTSRITSPKAVTAVRIRWWARARIVITCWIVTIRMRRTAVDLGRAHLRCHEEDAQQTFRESDGDRGARLAGMSARMRFPWGEDHHVHSKLAVHLHLVVVSMGQPQHRFWLCIFIWIHDKISGINTSILEIREYYIYKRTWVKERCVI